MNKQNQYKLMQCLYLAACFVGLIVFLALCRNQVDSDFAGEMIFSKLVSEEKGIFSRNWYYSTEINLLHTPLIMGLVFCFLSDWHVVRVVTGALIFALMLVSYFYYCRQAGHKKYAALFGSILVLPFGWGYLKYVLFGYYYANYIIISFFCLGMIYKLNDGKKDKHILTWIIYIVLSFLAGLGTIRQLVVLFYPLCLGGLILLIVNMWDECRIGQIRMRESIQIFAKAAAKNQYARYFFTMCVGAFVATVGYVLNVLVLRNMYSFNSYDRTAFVEIDFSRLGEVITGHFYALGYEKDREILSVFGISNILSLLLVVILAIMVVCMIRNLRKFKITSQICIVYFACAILVNLFIYTFSNLYAERYMIPYIIFFVAILNIYVEEYDTTVHIRRWVTILVMFIILYNSAVQYGQWIAAEDENDRSELIGFIEERGYEFGMGSFWNCNVITQLTNGRVAMRNVYAAKWSTLENEHWLEIKSYETLTSDRPMFILLSEEEYEANKELPHFAKDYLVYSDDRYRLFEYASSDALCEIAGVDYTDLSAK